MRAKEFTELRARFNDECEQLLRLKGADYASDTDRLANFKDIAAEIGVAPLAVWAVYFMKHIRAIEAFVRTGAAQSEAITGRFADARNYLDLGLALVAEAAFRPPAPEVEAVPPSFSVLPAETPGLCCQGPRPGHEV